MRSKTSRQLFVQHVEGLSRDAVTKYQHILRDFIKGRHGIYALYSKNKLVYVGLASNLRTRLNNHLRDRHANTWDKFSVYLTLDAGHMHELEALLIRIAKPEENRQRGKFQTSENLTPRLQVAMREFQSREFDRMFGERVVKQNRLVILETGRKPSLMGMLTRRTAIRMRYKGKIYSATVLKSGRIKYAGHEYNSPSMAGRAIVGRSIDGWLHWKYQTSNKEWVYLDTLRKQ